MSGETEIRPFRVDMPDEAVADLRRRIAATRWPSKELADDRSQGVQLATIKELARYWTTNYDWRACEAELNALPQAGQVLAGHVDLEGADGRAGRGRHAVLLVRDSCPAGRASKRMVVHEGWRSVGWGEERPACAMT